MRIILFIEDDTTIKKILMHLDLWTMNHDPPPGGKNRIAIHIGVLNGGRAVNHSSGND